MVANRKNNDHLYNLQKALREQEESTKQLAAKADKIVRDKEKEIQSGHNISEIARENKEALADAKDALDKEHYIAFKQALFIDETKRHKYNKTYKFEAGRVIAHHRRQYWNYVDKIGETLADIMFHGIAHLQYSPPCEEQI